MLRSSNCVLTGKTPAEFAKLNECPLDPGMCDFLDLCPLPISFFFFRFCFALAVVLPLFLKNDTSLSALQSTWVKLCKTLRNSVPTLFYQSVFLKDIRFLFYFKFKTSVPQVLTYCCDLSGFPLSLCSVVSFGMLKNSRVISRSSLSTSSEKSQVAHFRLF